LQLRNTEGCHPGDSLFSNFSFLVNGRKTSENKSVYSGRFKVYYYELFLYLKNYNCLNGRPGLMKTTLFLLLAGFCICARAYAGYVEIFSYNADQIALEMAQLNALEDFVWAHPGISYAELQTENHLLIKDLNLGTDFFGGTVLADGKRVLGIPPFIWGCVAGWVGVLVVYFVAKDDNETKSAALGCIISSTIWVIVYMIYYFYLFDQYY